ncbi:Trp biosynthesis-associated membrane protein [Nocardioides speluncae]|uniref:Trp biosynthesis-associated membrane protein n=1 Tax=Nocardioides speluncae TaxID=2670337 RepID=UPI000D68F1F2|nr:Trp biosynthesis-associated membrane protein [Nocardioides speluncae]
MSGDENKQRRTFGPVVLAGLAAGALAAVAGNQPWARPTEPSLRGLVDESVAEMPLAAALGLVVLACWGVLLVTRGRVRRLVGVLGALTSAGLLVTVVVGFTAAPDALREEMTTMGMADSGISRTGWYYVTALSAVRSLAATLAAVRLVPEWPEMGSRYDAPAAAEPASVPPEERSSLDLWKSLDDGQDPTA